MLLDVGVTGGRGLQVDQPPAASLISSSTVAWSGDTSLSFCASTALSMGVHFNLAAAIKARRSARGIAEGSHDAETRHRSSRSGRNWGDAVRPCRRRL